MDTEVIYAIGAVTVSILGALRFSRCTRIKCGCIEVDRDASTQAPESIRGSNLPGQARQPDLAQVQSPKPEA